MAMDYRLPSCPGASLVFRPVPVSPLSTSIYTNPHRANLTITAHHPSSSLAFSLDLPNPISLPPTDTGTSALHSAVSTHHTRSLGPVFPISISHCHCGPFSVIKYVRPLTATPDHFRLLGALLRCNGKDCLMPAGDCDVACI